MTVSRKYQNDLRASGELSHVREAGLRRWQRCAPLPALFLAAGVSLLSHPAASSAASGSGRLEKVRISGREYVRVRDWARNHNFTVHWQKRYEVLELSKTGLGKLVFTINSCQASVNGIQIWMSFPPIGRSGGAVYLPSADVRDTLEPLLWPEKAKRTSKLNLVCLDPGHGGKDPGNRVGRNEEKKYTLLLAQDMARYLKDAGVKVIFTRTTDQYIDLSARPAYAKRKGADLFVSLHFNSVGVNRNLARGAEVYCLTPAGATSTNVRGRGGNLGSTPGNRYNGSNVLLAYQIQKSLVNSLHFEDRGVRRARFAVLRSAGMPAALVEAGFLSHPVEGKNIMNAAYRRRLARAIVDGILAYKKAG